VPFTLVAGSSHPALAAALAKQLGVSLGHCEIERFPDGESQIEINCDVRGHQVFVLQTLNAPVGENLLELSLLSDALHRGGAKSVTAVIPYLGYARQDRRELGREPLGARVIAELLSAGRIDRLVCLDLHSRAVEGCFPQPLEHASAIEALTAQLADLPRPAVVVSPDLGAVKRAEVYARALDLPVAIIHKQRLTGADVAARGIVGEVKGLYPLVVDDIISTGGTMAASIQAVLDAGALPQVTIAATHGLFVGQALERLAKLPLRRVLITDSVSPLQGSAFPLHVVSAAPVLAGVIQRLAQ
jgi:ribose-phosphate pyrophosphokinase